MTTWPKEELRKIAEADDLHMSLFPTGPLRDSQGHAARDQCLCSSTPREYAADIRAV